MGIRTFIRNVLKSGCLKKKGEPLEESTDVYSSDSSDDDVSGIKYRNRKNRCWDKYELEKIQLDDHTIQRDYLKLQITRTIDKEDEYTLLLRGDAVRLPFEELRYQYFMENLMLY